MNKVFEQQYLSGEIEVHLTPQGNLAEKIRAGGAGIPAFFSPTGAGTLLETGKIPTKYAPDGKVLSYSKPREVREFNGKRYLLEESITGDFSFVKCWKADKDGNLVFHVTARNFNPDCATAGKIVIAEADEIVETGELKPDEIHCPGIFVDRVVKGIKEQKRIEKLTLKSASGGVNIACKSEEERQMRIRVAKRAANEIRPNMYVNLGIGMPTTVANFVDPDMNVYFHAENGLLGIGEYPEVGHEDPDLINAGKETVTIKKGGVILPSSMAFSVIRGGHLDMTILGGLQVAQNGDLANWIIPGKLVKGMGGAMDLVSSVKRVIVLMALTDKYGDKKFRKTVDLPVTGPSCVSTLITDQAVFDFTP